MYCVVIIFNQKIDIENNRFHMNYYSLIKDLFNIILITFIH